MLLYPQLYTPGKNFSKAVNEYGFCEDFASAFVIAPGN
jgi:hypothetical protein